MPRSGNESPTAVVLTVSGQKLSTRVPVPHAGTRNVKIYAMLHNLTVKQKILLMPLLALLALGLLLFISQMFMGRNNRLLTGIERSFVPALDLCRNLENMLTELQRGMQDAVAAADLEELATVDTFYLNFLQLLEQGQANPFFQNAQLVALKTEFERYYELARNTSQRLIEDGSMDAATVADLNVMSEQYNALKAQVETMTDLAKHDVSSSFAATLQNYQRSSSMMITIILCSTLMFGGIAFLLVRSISTPLYQAIQVANQFVEGKRQVRIPVRGHDEISELGEAFNRMMSTLETQDWLKTGQVTLNERMRGEQDIASLSQNIISYLATYLALPIAAIYLSNDDQGEEFQLTGSYAYDQRKGNRNVFKLGEGLIGQAALEKQHILFSDVPENYLAIQSGLGEVTPHYILVFPLLHEQTVKGVLELGTVHQFTEVQRHFIEQVAENIAIAFHSAQIRKKMHDLLEETQRQSETLQTQQEELRQANLGLEEQTRALRASEERLQTQQEELRQTNEELESQTRALERQKHELGQKNRDLDNARQLLEKRAKDLELASKYKSEFLANMSHELRTPLNSLLILSKLLSQNKDGNLTAKQVEYAQTIYTAGSELLELINEVLDLSKVEAGRSTLNPEHMKLSGLLKYVEQHFTHVVEKKKIALKLELAEGLPETIYTDRQRVEQIVKNLLSNAVKFTSQGEVGVHIAWPAPNADLARPDASQHQMIAITIFDTGIGIPLEKQRLIFEAFQQVDGSISRKYGGTGLGLSIVREFTKLLEGEIHLQSVEGQGSSFTLYLPLTLSPTPSEPSMMYATPPALSEAPATPAQSSRPVGKDGTRDWMGGVEDIRDDRLDIHSPAEKTLLIIEDDAHFAKVLFDLARERGFKGLIAGDGAAGLQLAYQFLPSAILLDISLPGIDGWSVMKKLKDDSQTRHIPVHFISGQEPQLEAWKMGAIGYLTKPVTTEQLNEAFRSIEKTLSKTIKRLLIVEDDPTAQLSMQELLGGADVSITIATTGTEAYAMLHEAEFDCMVLDLGLEGMSGFELIEKIHEEAKISHLPIIIYTAQELTKKEEQLLKRYTESIVVKGVKSPERLLDQVTLFLHRIESALPKAQQQQLHRLHDHEAVLHEKTVLMVDDDIRNVFALSNVLEEKGMTVLVAENGKEALAMLAQHAEIGLVLMDIMMPEMDGYEAIHHIRQQAHYHELPIIALTAKAMKGDRQRCLEAGANDYLSKPVDSDKLLSLLRVWLY